MANLTIILAGVGALILIGALWVWNHLWQQLSELRDLEKKLTEVLEHRYDTIPFLLESYRGLLKEMPQNGQKIIDERTKAREAKDFKALWEVEQALEKELTALFKQTATYDGLQKDIGWLEARTELEEAADHVQNHENRYNALRTFLEEKTKKVPYVLFKSYVAKRI